MNSSRAELEIEEHIEFQRAGWAADRIGWAVMFAVILAALGGLFGNGLLGANTIATPDGSLQLTYDRFGRYGADSTLTARLSEGALREGEWRLAIARKYLEGMAIDNIEPEPDTVDGGNDALIYTFIAGETTDTVVTFDMTGDSVGSLHGTARLEGSLQSVSFDQFFFP
jgi:hypothetical protein